MLLPNPVGNHTNTEFPWCTTSTDFRCSSFSVRLGVPNRFGGGGCIDRIRFAKNLSKRAHAYTADTKLSSSPRVLLESLGMRLG